jgi:protein TonB
LRLARNSFAIRRGRQPFRGESRVIRRGTAIVTKSFGMAALAPIASPPARAPREPHPDTRPLLVSFVGAAGLAPTPLGRGVTLLGSVFIHVVLILLTLVVPLFFIEEILPVPGDGLRAFFAAPPEVAPPPPPPPPPPPAGARALPRAPAAARLIEAPKFVAPIEVPDVLPPIEPLDLGVEGGVPGGVEGGVPGGVVGGIVGGLPSEPAPPPPRVVRVGGAVTAPKLIDVVRPEYPLLARQARLAGIVILEAHVGVDGRVKEVTPLRGPPLLVDEAVAAIKQWRYRPLLLNGAPVEFVLTVTVTFSLTEAVVTR